MEARCHAVDKIRSAGHANETLKHEKKKEVNLQVRFGPRPCPFSDAHSNPSVRYFWPELRLRHRAEALRPLLILHSFRFIGLAFLIPGVVAPDLPASFAHAAAYGDIIAAILALLSLLLLPSAAGVVATWIFSLWGCADLFNAFYQANHAGLLAGQLGAAFFLPTLVVPLLLITHGLGFRILLQPQPEPVMHESGALAQGR